jgi:L-lactate dehydrogenase complex protein LldF
MHIVLVDNGRSEMRADPHFKEALRCIRCAACANICPSYQQVGGHAFGYIYSGAIGLVVTPFHHGLEADAGPQSLCVSCNACETVCPVEIPLPSLILNVRSRVVEAKGLPWLKKVIFGVMARPRLFDMAVRFFSITQFPMTRGSKYISTRRLGLVGKLPGVRAIANLARWRSLPAFATKPLRDRVNGQLLLSSGNASGQDIAKHTGITVCYFAGCMIDRLFPEMGEAAIKVLSACGVQVTFPQQQNCCGLIALNSGDRADCMRMARQTIVMLERALAESNADYIVGATTSCVVTLTQDYARLFEELQQQGWLRRAQALAEKVIDFASFVDHVLLANGTVLPVRKSGSKGDDVVVTYHDSCQSINCLGLRSEARHIIQDTLGLELREMPQSDVCCGFGGTTSIEHSAVAERIMNNKLDNAESTGATVLVTDNPGCLMHLRGGVDAGRRRVRVLHLAELMAERLDAAP